MRLRWPRLIVLASLLAACSRSKMPPEYIGDRDRLSTAFTAFGQATDLSQPPAGEARFTMSRQREDSIRRLIAVGIASADSIGDRFLDWLHPEMKHYLRDYYIRGQQLYLEGQTTGDAGKQMEGNRLIGEWYSRFWNANSELVTSKALPD